MTMTTRDSLALDDLTPGRWYRFRVPMGCYFEAQWLGFDGRQGLLREEGSRRVEEWPCDLLARSTITAIPPPVEIIEPIAERQQAADDSEAMPLSPREKRWIVLCILGGCIFWSSLFLWAFWR